MIPASLRRKLNHESLVGCPVESDEDEPNVSPSSSIDANHVKRIFKNPDSSITKMWKVSLKPSFDLGYISWIYNRRYSISESGTGKF